MAEKDKEIKKNRIFSNISVYSYEKVCLTIKIRWHFNICVYRGMPLVYGNFFTE
jgi:hypothetical protein